MVLLKETKALLDQRLDGVPALSRRAGNKQHLASASRQGKSARSTGSVNGLGAIGGHGVGGVVGVDDQVHTTLNISVDERQSHSGGGSHNNDSLGTGLDENGGGVLVGLVEDHTSLLVQRGPCGITVGIGTQVLASTGTGGDLECGGGHAGGDVEGRANAGRSENCDRVKNLSGHGCMWYEF